jgi:Ca2+-binding EF-hand superfamily protein
LRDEYGGRKGLDATGSALSSGVLARLDPDGNGTITDSEIAALVDAKPDLTLKIGFDGQSATAPPTIALEPVDGASLAAGVEVRSAPHALNLVLGELDLDIYVADLVGDAEKLVAAKARFALLDADSDGFLDDKELAAVDSKGGSSVESLDKDGDGKASLDEARNLLAEECLYRSALVQVSVGRAEDPLFDWLDTNRDRRLAARELLGATERLAQLDGDGDGIVTPAEIPQRLVCAIVRGPNAERSMPAPRATQSAANADAPPWLTAMDQNADGEVSRREFLGTLEQFSRLDVNGDGSIDAAEARDQAESAAGTP